MTEVFPESLLGPIVTKPAITGLSRFDIISEEAQAVKRLAPEPTVWGYGNGRPIYDRLPGVSEAYRLDYFGDERTGLVYIDPQFGTLSGPGSLEVGKLSNDASILVVQSGTITWSFGQISTTGLAVDLRTIVADGAQDGVYQVGYYLNYTRPEDVDYATYLVTGSSLSNTLSVYRASAEASNSPVEYAFSEIDDGSWRPNSNGAAGDYTDGSSVFVDFTQPVTAGEFELQGPPDSTAQCALYSSEDAIVWKLDAQTLFNNGWRLSVSRDTPARYWKFFFWDGRAEVTNILYTGEAFFPNQRPSGPISSAELFIDDDQFAEIERPHILLAQVEVKEQQVLAVTDLRRQTSVRYEPVAKWLTDFQDNSLRSLITDVSEYSAKYMAPGTACDDMYRELSSETFLLGEDTERKKVDLPDRVELEPPSFLIKNAEVLFHSNSSVRPSKVIQLAHPTEPGDLATKFYVDSALIPSLDNGKY